jgi:hypothetical protein
MTPCDDKQNSTTSTQSRNDTNNSNNDEIWALLNYSKVRLATGTTPKEKEAKALGLVKEDVAAGGGGEKGFGRNKVPKIKKEEEEEEEEENNKNDVNSRLDSSGNRVEIACQDEYHCNVTNDCDPNDGGEEPKKNVVQKSDSMDHCDDDDNEDNVDDSFKVEEDTLHSHSSYHDVLLPNKKYIRDELEDQDEDQDDDDDDDDDISDDEDFEDDAISDDYDDEDEEEEEGDNDDDEEEEEEINHAEIAASRARAMAALARTRDLYGPSEEDMEHEKDEYSDIRNMGSNYKHDALTSVVVGHEAEVLTEKQLLKSMALAEREAQRGASEFSTQKKLHLLDQMSTPKGKDGNIHRRTGFGIGSGGERNGRESNKRDLAIGSEIKKIGQRAHVFWNNSKLRAEKAVKDIKMNVAKIERKQQQFAVGGVTSKSIGTTTIASSNLSPRSHEELKKESPLKKFTETIAKVERMNEQKYGHEIHFV